MPVRRIAPAKNSHSFRPSRSLQVALLTGVSALALVLTGAPARALQLATMRGGAFNVTANAAAAAVANAQQAQQTSQQSMSSLLRATQAIQAMQQTQVSARAVAAKAASTVPNGLGVGGLQPAVSAPVSAANDPTGLATWEGAGMPTQTAGANGTVNVTVNQTQNNAVLDWKSFNVGAQTNLTFDQQGNANWVALNRVVGSTAPSQILGSIKADGTVLVINQNGIVFGAGAQVNVNSLIASSLDIGGSTTSAMSVQQRNLQFEQEGIIGISNTGQLNQNAPNFSTLDSNGPVEGDVTVEAGATITANDTPTSAGLILLMAPHVENAGNLTAPDGQIALEAGRYIFLTPSDGTSSSLDPNVRGLVFLDDGTPGGTNDYYAWNQSSGFIEADRGNISMGSAIFDFNNPNSVTPTAAVINDGVLLATTSVSRNGSIILDGGNVQLSPGSVLAILPDTDGETIPTDPTTLSEFKPSDIEIGQEGTNQSFFNTSNVDIESNATIYAPSANITIGGFVRNLFVDNGADIDVSGLENVAIPATRNQVTITPITANELADDPNYRGGFLAGATIYLDPRLSGVREDGVAWTGSPLIDAEAFYQFVGVQADELMTTGGNINISASTSTIIKSGAVINIAGGWVSYQAGNVRQTLLVDASGNIIPIGQADPFTDTFVGIYGSFAVDHSHWGVTEFYTGGMKSDETFDPAYTQGRDAGSLVVSGQSQILDGTILAQAFPGQQQIADGQEGTGTSTITGDQRPVQAANSQLPIGGFLSITNSGLISNGQQVSLGNVDIVASTDYPPVASDTSVGQVASVGSDGSLQISASVAPSDAVMARLATLTLSDHTLSNFSDVSITANGAVNVAKNAVVDLGNGGVFNVMAGHAITIDGSVIAPSGTIALQTFMGADLPGAPSTLGDFDITINGTLNVAGLWVNDFGQPDANMEGGAWLNGGSISIYAASHILSIDGAVTDTGDSGYQSPQSTETAEDISGSILINPGSLLDLSGGGRVDQKGNFTLTAKGGNLSLKSDTTYFQLFGANVPEDLSGFRVANPNPNSFGASDIQVNPDAINARISIDTSSIEAWGFGGGGTFTLTTPEFSFGTGSPATGTELPMNFFSQAGFATYNITSYKTEFFASTFTNDEGGYNAVLATQVLTIGPGQNLPLQQSYLPVELTLAQRQGLFAMPDGSGSDILSIVQPTVPSDAWDQKPVSLTLGGLIELDVAPGGSITGAAGASLTVSKLLDASTIRIPGGTITQDEILPAGYAAPPSGGNATSGVNGGIHQLSDIFTIAPDGTIDPDAEAVAGGTNGEVAGDTDAPTFGIYFLGTLNQNQGIVLAPGSTTDLSGTVIDNPFAAAANGTPLTQGRVVAGGTITAVAPTATPAIFKSAGFYSSDDPTGLTDPDQIIAEAGSTLNISGTSATMDQFVGGVGIGHIGGLAGYVMTPVWSDAGSINANNGGSFAGATIMAQGGAPEAQGGTLTILDPILAQHDPATSTTDVVSEDMIAASGIDTLVAIGSVSSQGDATIQLGDAFVLEGRPELSFGPNSVPPSNSTVIIYRTGFNSDRDVPRVSATGNLTIEAPDISVNSPFNVINDPRQGTAGTGSVTFDATDIDITGSLLFDESVANATLSAKGDISLTGVATWQSTLIGGQANPPSFTLNGMIAANGNLSLIAGQVYPTTGSSYSISSTAANGTIAFGRSSDVLLAVPFSAGGNLSVEAANIVQGGVIRVPFGSLTLGSDTPDDPNGATITFAPATQTLTFTDGSVTSVSAGGLNIPYGTTTDQTEWFFTPTDSNPLEGPPAKIMTFGAASITIDQGATLDLSGGGDVYAYEFIPGTGGTHDVLSQQNANADTGNNGLTYPDGRQVYAIVPGLSNNPAAAYDPIYSANYASLYGPDAGQRVYLSGGNGLAAGWYTLLPAQYALLPGGMRVVQQTGATNVIPGTSFVEPDGSLLVSGHFGNAFSGSQESQNVEFSVDFQSQILGYSQIATTSGATLTNQAAQRDNLVVLPQIGADAGRLVLNPLSTLVVDATALTAPATGGRGAEVDLGGTDIDILSSLDNAPADGAIHVTATSLDNLNADSLLVGAIRTDNTDGTTDLDVSAQNILVANDAANPLTAPEIVLVVDDLPSNSAASSLTLADGATIIATGTVSDTRDGAYVINGIAAETTPDSVGEVTISAPENSATGALFRVSNGPQRAVERETNAGTPVVPAATLNIGNIIAQGQSILLDTSNGMSIAGGATFRAQSLTLDAPAIVFSTSDTPVSGAVVIDPTVEALLSQAGTLILNAQTTIGFDNGSYQFGNTTFNAQELASIEGGDVVVNAGDVAFGNIAAAGTATAGGGTLDVNANTITFGTGDLATSGFGAIDLTGAKGMFIGGAGAGFNAGSAALTLTTPYIGDRAVTNLPTEAAGDVTITTTGALTITNAGTAPFDAGSLNGLSGSSLTLDGSEIVVSGTTLRATSGTLSLVSTGGIALSNGAVLEAPGYTRTFGDSADPQTVSAPGGALTLTAGTDIDLGNASISVGGGSGNAGTLTLSAPNGTVALSGASLNGTGGAGSAGATFSLDTAGSVDLVALSNFVGAQGFTGFDIATETGDIDLAAGQTIRAGSVSLTANGGLVDIAGTIDTSGVNGGDIDLFGNSGVTLEGTARLEAYAIGYAAADPTDTRQATGGNVTIGTDFRTGTTSTNADGSISGASGVINVDAGAVIDVSAKHPGDRLVDSLINGVVYYQLVQGDQGGTVTFRAPVVSNGAGGDTVDVNVASASSVAGASAIDLEGFKKWDLEAVANSGLFSGVTFDASTNTVTLDVTAGLDTANPDGTLTTVAGINFLGDNGTADAPTVVDFVQNFDISSDYAHLGGLAGQANFQARPGIELDATGNITLASNWNLGAGVVNVTAAEAAGLMQIDPTTGEAYVVPGDEAALLLDYTNLIYRVGRSVTGAAPIVSLRAGGNLHLQGSLTDGFFEFEDQSDPTFLANTSGGSSVYTFQLTYYGTVGSYESYSDRVSGMGSGTNYFYTEIDIEATNPGASSSGSAAFIHAPYDAAGNSPAAQGAAADGAGDPLDSAGIFPLLAGGRDVASSSYRLTAGAALGSANPGAVAANGAGNLIVDGPKQVTEALPSAGSTADVIIDLQNQIIGSFEAGQSGFDTFLENLSDGNGNQAFPGLTGDAEISVFYSNEPSAVTTFANAHVGDGSVTVFGSGETDMSLTTFAQFMAGDATGLTSGGGASSGSANLVSQTFVRTGTGSITLAAAGNVDLTGGAPQYLDLTTNTITSTPPTSDPRFGVSDPELGGAAVYTVGHPVDPSPETLTDPLTGVAVTVDPTDFLPTPITPEESTKVQDLPVANPLLLDDGGDISISAGQDVLGRRDLSLQVQINTFFEGNGQNVKSLPGYGSAAEPWRVQKIGTDEITSEINPAGFRSAVGALGGGNITIDAGRDVSDLSVDTDHSIVTASATPAGGVATLAVLSFGSGNLDVFAGRDILGGSFEIADGAAMVSAGRDIADGPQSIVGQQDLIVTLPDGTLEFPTQNVFLADPVQISIDDAVVDMQARGSISFQGVTALGAADTGTSVSQNIAGGLSGVLSEDAEGLYSAHSGLDLLANGSITASNATLNPSPVVTIGSSADVYPASLNATSITGDLAFDVLPPAINSNQGGQSIELIPSPVGQLNLFAGGDILPTTIAMLDSDPGNLPGVFSSIEDVLPFAFPAVEPGTSQLTLQEYHNKIPTHENDPAPVRVYADGDIGDSTQGVTLSVAKQARVYAGQDIINMIFFGQNLQTSDITRVVAGRDIIATTALKTPLESFTISGLQVLGTPEPALLGNTFVLGGPGQLFLEAGRNLGPFLNSANISLDEEISQSGNTFQTTNLSFSGGVISVGNDDNPFLPATGADVNVLFGVAKGIDFDALRDDYVAPGTAANAVGGYSAALVTWMQQNEAQDLIAAYGTTNVDATQAYAVFTTLPELNQEIFLLADVYFNELQSTDTPNPVYARGYQAVNTLFPASLGYTANNLSGGANGANQLVATGNLDLRLATIETTRGGNIRILGPGGNVLAGSVVSTSVQAARRSYIGYQLYDAFNFPFNTTILPEPIESIPTGSEGVLTLRGGDIDSFTDGSFEVNQSRVFTEEGGNILLWSSNGDLNAGEGAKTTASFPPVVVQIDDDAFTQVDAQGGVTGAGIATLESTPDSPPGNASLIAPRGTVDAGAAGVRVSGNLAVAALHVLNADNFEVQGTTTGIPTVAAPNIGALDSASNAAGAATKAIDSSPQSKTSLQPSILIVEIEGYGGDDGSEPAQAPSPDEHKKQNSHADEGRYDPNAPIRLVGYGAADGLNTQGLTQEEKQKLTQP